MAMKVKWKYQVLGYFSCSVHSLWVFHLVVQNLSAQISHINKDMKKKEGRNKSTHKILNTEFLLRTVWH